MISQQIQILTTKNQSAANTNVTHSLSELRVPKIVFNQLDLLYKLFQIVKKQKDSLLSHYNPYIDVNIKQFHQQYHHVTVIDPLQQMLENFLHIPSLSSSISRLVIRLVDDSHLLPYKIYPQIIHRFYYTALLQQKLYDRVFIKGSLLVSHIDKERSAFANLIYKVIDLVAKPRYIKWLEQMLQVDNPNHGLYFLKLNDYISAIISIINIIEHTVHSLLTIKLSVLLAYLQKGFHLINKALVFYD